MLLDLKPHYFWFTDFVKTFDSMVHKKLSKIIEEM